MRCWWCSRRTRRLSHPFKGRELLAVRLPVAHDDGCEDLDKLTLLALALAVASPASALAQHDGARARANSRDAPPPSQSDGRVVTINLDPKRPPPQGDGRVVTITLHPGRKPASKPGKTPARTRTAAHVTPPALPRTSAPPPPRRSTPVRTSSPPLRHRLKEHPRRAKRSRSSSSGAWWARYPRRRSDCRALARSQRRNRGHGDCGGNDRQIHTRHASDSARSAACADSARLWVPHVEALLCVARQSSRNSGAVPEHSPRPLARAPRA